MCKIPDWYRKTEYWILYKPLPKQFIPQIRWNWAEIDRLPVSFVKRYITTDLHWPILKCLLPWMKQLFINRTNSVKNDCFLSNGAVSNCTQDQISGLVNLFLSACFCWEFRLSLREMDQKYKFDETIGNGDSYSEFLFRHLKVFTLDTILHDAARAVRVQSGKGPGYCYKICRGPVPSLLGRVTGLQKYFCVKFVLP